MKKYLHIKGLVIIKLLIFILVTENCTTGNMMSCSICGRTNHYTSDCKACYKCGKLGHKADDCTYIKCNNCHKPGHLAKDCTNVDCRKCGKHGHRAAYCTYIECRYCHKPGHLQKDCTQKPCKKCNKKGHKTKDCIQCRNCNKFGHLKKDCLLCKNCLRVGHHTSECHSCYVCGKDHKTISCRPKKPQSPKVWRDSETGAIISRKYKDIYPRLVEGYKRQLDRKANYFINLRELGMETNKTFQYKDDDKVIDVYRDLINYSEQYKVERKKEIEEDKERFDQMNYREEKVYVSCCSVCGECIGGGCDGHP